MVDDQDREDRVGIGSRLPEPDEATLIRLEETAEARPGGWRGVGFLRARKQVDLVTVEETIPAATEDVDLERVPVSEGDPGGVETLPDGGVSIPIYEEQVVITKRVVLRERVVIRKRITAVVEPVRAELRRERVEIDVDDDVRDRVELPEEWTEQGGTDE
jgi:uncharacterized protein (TIGR02271 family)